VKNGKGNKKPIALVDSNGGLPKIGLYSDVESCINLFRHVLSEYQYRFNRRFDLAGMLTNLLFAGVMTGSRSESWLRLAED